MPAPVPLLDPELLRRLETLRLVTRERHAGRLAGIRPSRRTGASVEFADYREYQPGDDPRYVDWNVYARLERLFVKLSVAEQDLPVTLAVDASLSMSFGTPSKLDRAKQLAAALGFGALAGGDRLRLSILPPAALGSNPFPLLSATLRGKSQAFRLFRWLSELKPSGRARLGRTLSHLAAALRVEQGGLFLLISDLADPDGPEAFLPALTSLAGAGQEVVLLHLLSPEETDPGLAGDFLLLDGEEEGATLALEVNRRTRELYRQELLAWLETIRRGAAATGADHLVVETDRPWEEVVFDEMVRIGRVGSHAHRR